MSPSPDRPESRDWLRAGNREAFKSFYRKHTSRLQNFLRRSVGDSRVAEDIAHEAFLHLWQHCNGFNPARGSARAYLFGIAAKRALDWWRHQPPKGPAHREGSIRGGSWAVLIVDALEKIDPDMRSLLWLREVEGYSYQELAEMLEIPLGTVRSRLFAAREQFRQVWKGEGASEEL